MNYFSDNPVEVTMANNWASDEDWLVHGGITVAFYSQASNYLQTNSEGFVSYADSLSSLRLFDGGTDPVLSLSAASRPLAHVGFSEQAGAVIFYIEKDADGNFHARCFANKTNTNNKRRRKKGKDGSSDCLLQACVNACCVQQPDYSHSCQLTCNGCQVCNPSNDICESHDCK